MVVQDFITDHTVCPTVSYGSPQWSRDGSLIYYSYITRSAATSTHELNVISSSGADNKFVAHDIPGPIISPDGTMILFTRPDPNARKYKDFYILDLMTLQTRRVIHHGEVPSWSPDSQWIAYAPPGNLTGPIYKTNVQTGQTITLTSTVLGGDSLDFYPVWSPDGKRIAFSGLRNSPRPSVFVMNADGSNVTQLNPEPDPACTSDDGHGGPLAWSPDGGTLVVTHWCGRNERSLRIITPEGRVMYTWDIEHANDVFMSWSPDGRQIMFLPSDPSLFIALADPDRSNFRLLDGFVFDPAWSPDGKQIAFTSDDQARTWQLYVMNTDGSGLKQLTNNLGPGDICIH